MTWSNRVVYDDLVGLITVVAREGIVTSVRAVAQSRLAFEVVSIKAVPRPTPQLIRSGYGLVFNIDPAHVRIVGYTPFALVATAFRVEQPQVDAPDFARSEYFEIQATLPAGAMPEQVPEMLQTMLAGRFKLAYHRETREYHVSVLTVGKSGMKLPRLPDGLQAPPPTSTQLSDGSTRMTQTGNVKSLFPVMNSFGGLQMVDETGLDRVYTWVRSQPPVTAGMTYRAAVQESFKAMTAAAGLKLEERKVLKETTSSITWKRCRPRTEWSVNRSLDLIQDAQASRLRFSSLSGM